MSAITGSGFSGLTTGGAVTGATAQAQNFTLGVNVNNLQGLRVGLNHAQETLVGVAGGGTGYVGTMVTAVGFYAARENTAANVTATGYYAAYQNTGASVTATGYSAAYQNTGANVTANGLYAARENTAANVTATGFYAAYQNTGANVTATGFYAAYQNTGENVTTTGYYAAYQNTGANVTANGYQAARGNTYSNTIAIGAYALPTKANQAVIGAQNGFGTSQIDALTIVSGTSGGALEGLGASSTTGQTAMARIAWTWTTSTHATRQAKLTAYVSDYNGERTLWSGDATGSEPRLAFFGATPVTRPVVDTGAELSVVIQALQNLGLFRAS